MDEYLGVVKLFAGNYTPKGWAFCDGSLMKVHQYPQLYAVLGFDYGGNGTTDFALPDLRNRVPVGVGNGQPTINQGDTGGSANVTLTTQQMPMHTHTQQFANVPSTTNSPSGNLLSQITAADGDGVPLTASGYAPAAALVAGAPQAIDVAGGSQPFSIMQPYLGMNYIICIQGIYPPRS